MKVLVANRGEIAVRVIRACREMGLATVAVFSECDRESWHVRLADEACYLGPSPAAESYLRIDALVEIARRSGAAFVHPGYGFLAENADFAQAVGDAGITFIGPGPDAIRRMGGKTAAREAAQAAGVPIVPGGAAFGEGEAIETIGADAARIGYPLLVKAVAGGGGKGMRVVSRPADLGAAIRVARSEARAAFGDGAVYLERQLVGPRHIEIQLLADADGTVIPFVERECSIQRRRQKVVEESPSLAIAPDLRRRMAEAAARIARAVGYVNAGTIEFLVDDAGAFYFLEMNTRLQVEHPVTEFVTGLDLVQWQIRIARGERLTVPPDQALSPRGHAIECRIYAEDPDQGFLPSPDRIRAITTPGGPFVRDDRGVTAGFTVPTYYDSMIAKLIVWGETRAEAIGRLRRALDEYRVVGVKTTLPFFRWLIDQPDFIEGRFSTTYLDELLASRQGRPFGALSETEERDAAIAAALAAWFAARAAASPGSRSIGAAWRRTARQESIR